MNELQATRPIKKGAVWTDGETEVTVTKASTQEVAYRTETGGHGLTETWYFREQFVPVRGRGERAGVPALPSGPRRKGGRV